MEYANLIEENLMEYQIALANALPGGKVHVEEGITWTITDKTYKMYNGVYRTNLADQDVDEQILRVLEEYRLRGVRATWQIGPSSNPSNLAERLEALGWTHDEDEPAMALNLNLKAMRAEFAYPSNFEICRVSTISELNDWVSVWAYDATDEFLRHLQEIHQMLAFHDHAPWTYYLGLLDGKPVATSKLFLGSKVTAVHWVVTIPSARKRGIGAAMTLEAVKDAQRLGHHTAILTASPQGAGIYQKIGFQPYCTIRKYEWRGKAERI